MTSNTEIKPARRRMPRSLRLILGVLDIYGFCAVFMIAAWLFTGENGWLASLTPNLMPGLFFPAPFLLVIGLLARRKRMILPTLFLLGIFVWLYGGTLIPRSSQGDLANPVAFLTYNTHAETKELEPLLTVIRDANADIVALQELSTPAETFLRRELAAEYPYIVAYTNGESVMGRGIFSRYPVQEDQLGYDGGREIYLRAVLDVNGRDVVIHNVHLSPPAWGVLINFDSSYRHQNMQTLLRDTSQETLPLVMLGDYNMPDQTTDYHQIAQTYQDAYRVVGDGLGMSFPDYGRMAFPLSVLQPFIRLDYVFYSGDDWTANKAQVWGNSGGSDHRPLFVILGLRGLHQD